MIRYGPRRGLALKPPPVGARLDWSKPRTRGLVGCWLFHENAGAPHDLVSGATAVPGGTGVVWSSSPLGPALEWDVAATGYYATGCPQPDTTTGLTYLVGIRTGASGQGSRTLVGGGTSGTTLRSSSSNLLEFLKTNQVAFSNSGSQFTFPGRSVVGASYDGTTLRYWSNGAQLGTDVVNSQTITSQPLLIGAANADGSAEPWREGIDWVLAYARVLSPAEIAALSTDPLGSVLWQPRVRLPTGTVAVQYLRPASDVAAGTWTPVPASPTTFYDKLDEAAADDADYAYSATYPASDVLTVTLSSATDPTSSTGHVVRYRYRNNTGGGQGTLLVELLQGASTVIASWTHSGITSSSWVQANQTLTGTQADNITDYSTLRLRFTASVG